MEKSSFQFSRPQLLELKYVINENSSYVDGTEFDIRFGLNIQRDSTQRQATVALRVEVGEEANKDVPFHIVAAMKSTFTWNESDKPAAIDVMLKQNATALLISYIRPVVASVMNWSSYQTFEIPFIDVTTLDINVPILEK